MGQGNSVDYKDKGAVITGGASGIGLAAAKRCLSLGMRVVICDVNSTSLNRAVAELREQNRHVLGVKVDVSKLEDNEVMLERAKSFLGPNNIAFVFLNAGISDEPGCAWESNPKELKKSMDVCFYGVFYGMHVMMPHLLKQDTKSVIASTASVAGLFQGSTFPMSIGYTVAKHGVVLISENARVSLKKVKKTDKVSVHVLCPFVTLTNMTAGKGFPDSILATPESVVSRLHEGIINDVFYIVAPDNTGDLESAAAFVKAKANAVAYGNSPDWSIPELRKLRDEYKAENARGETKASKLTRLKKRSKL